MHNVLWRVQEMALNFLLNLKYIFIPFYHRPIRHTVIICINGFTFFFLLFYIHVEIIRLSGWAIAYLLLSFTCALRRLRANILTRCKIWTIKNNNNNNNNNNITNIIMFVLSQERNIVFYGLLPLLFTFIIRASSSPLIHINHVLNYHVVYIYKYYKS
jgi:hypothetical protein